MNCVAPIVLSLINFGLIALLPHHFFKRGAQLTPHFWITASPLFASPLCLALGYAGVIPVAFKAKATFAVLSSAGVIAAALSILLLGLALGSHRAPVHMFHDTNDQAAPQLVTEGPYRHIRHPIYCAYLLALCGAALIAVQLGTAICLLAGFLLFNHTAAQEEQRLLESPELRDTYRAYMQGTGRFFPPWPSGLQQASGKRS